MISILLVIYLEMLSDACSKVKEAEHGEASLLKKHDLTQMLQKLKHVTVAHAKVTS